MEEFTAEVDALCESVHSVTDDFNSALTEINAQETGTLALIQKYEDLATQIDRTDAEQAALEAVTKKRTASYPKLAEQLENASMSADDFVEAMKRACEQQAEQQRQQEAQEATDSTLTYEQAVSTAYESVRAEVEELCAAYDKAYQSALESFEGQFGLFDEAAANMESTVANAQAALDSQLAYWESYNTNLETLTAYGETLTGDARANTSTTTAVSVEANASGTTNAGDIFIAGEDGPELIVGKAGSTVFPADETERIISAMPLDSDNLTTSYALTAPEDKAGNEVGGEQTKRITLEIAGGSPIEVNGSGGASKEDIVEILVANLRPALLNLVSEEIFEEGDGSYEY